MRIQSAMNTRILALTLIAASSVILLAPGINPCRACGTQSGVLAAGQSVSVPFDTDVADSLVAIVDAAGPLVAEVEAGGRPMGAIVPGRAGAGSCRFDLAEGDAGVLMLSNPGRSAVRYSARIARW